MKNESMFMFRGAHLEEGSGNDLTEILGGSGWTHTLIEVKTVASDTTN